MARIAAAGRAGYALRRAGSRQRRDVTRRASPDPTLIRRRSDATLRPVSARSSELADELKQVVRLAGRDPEALEGTLPALSGLHRVASAGELDEPARVHLILHRLIPEYLERLPAGRDCRAIRELLTWEDEDGETQSLTTRYHKAAAHLVNAASDFGRRQEPRLLAECARRFIALDHEDRLADGGPAYGPGPAAGRPRPSARRRLRSRSPPSTIPRPASCACTSTSTTTCSSSTWPTPTRS